MAGLMPQSHSGRLHSYAQNLLAFEHIVRPEGESPDNVLLLVAGLGEGIFSNSLYARLAKSLQRDYRVIELGLTSSFQGWGVSSVGKDAEEILRAGSYFRKLYNPKKMVVLGHSTGCQDLVHLFVRLTPDQIEAAAGIFDGAVLLSPVSDRDWIVNSTDPDELEKSLEEAERLFKEGVGSTLMRGVPMSGFEGTPISARRWASLAGNLSRFPWGEDFFGESLNEVQKNAIWGRMARSGLKNLLFMMPGADQYFFSKLGIEGSARHWAELVDKAGNGSAAIKVEVAVVDGADHSFTDEIRQEEVISKLRKWMEGF